jgi:hypothetical protein
MPPRFRKPLIDCTPLLPPTLNVSLPPLLLTVVTTPARVLETLTVSAPRPSSTGTFSMSGRVLDGGAAVAGDLRLIDVVV